MNPETNKFEKLFGEGDGTQEEDERNHQNLQRLLQEQARQPRVDDPLAESQMRLVRADGSPVPVHWPIFAVGERLVIKDYTFEVVDISEDRILFKPVGTPIVGASSK